MRELKFRMWYYGYAGDDAELTDSNEMVYMDSMFNCYGQLGFSNEHYVDLGEYDKEDCEIMQYTGLKDKNGKGNYIDTVEWGNSGWMPFENNKGYDGIIMYWHSDCEVIGNIYENPELIKE